MSQPETESNDRRAEELEKAPEKTPTKEGRGDAPGVPLATEGIFSPVVSPAVKKEKKSPPCLAQIKYSTLCDPPEKTKSKVESVLTVGINAAEKSEPANYTTLVISGGSSKGFIALGALQYAQDHFYLDQIKTFIGTSIGAIIGYFLALGLSPTEVLVDICVNHVGKEFEYYNLSNVLNGEGFFSFDILLKHMERATIEKVGRYLTLGEIWKIYGKKLIFCTYNLTLGKVEYLSPDTYPEMPALIAIRMSSNLPLVFEKFHYMGSTYIDGGFADNFPLHLANRPGEKILAINMMPNVLGLTQEKEKSLASFIHHLLFIPTIHLVKNQLAHAPANCDVIEIVRPDAQMVELMVENKEKLNLFSRGYRQCRKFFERK